MKQVYRWLLLGWIVILGVAGSAEASHIVGGNLELIPEGGGLYTVCVVLYYDANSSDPNAEQSEITVSFFRKKDNNRITDLRLTRVSKQPLTFTNPGCAVSRNLKINVVKFAASIRLNTGEFNDPAGNYLSWERCCRSADVGNLRNAGTSSLVLYLEFPPISVANTSPQFRPANGEILCRNTPYQFESGATDPDGDELRYRLETPFNSTRPPFGIDPVAPATAGPYPKSEWGSGFSPINSVPGKPTLTLNPTTGSMNLTPTQTGLFVYRVVVEEYRNGRKIGEVHRDYQLLVIDCSNENPTPVALKDALYPPNTSFSRTNSNLEVGICQGDTIGLKADDDPKWAYQWQRDGVNIEKANLPAFAITQEGTYSVVKTFADRCGNAQALSEKFEVKYRSDDIQITPGPQASVCQGTALDLSLNVGGPGWAFGWLKDGSAIAGASTASLTGLTEAGTYVVKATNQATGCVSSDTVKVSLQALPAATLTAPFTQLCAGDSVRLQANEGTDLAYVWYQGGMPLPTPLGPSHLVKKAGFYSVVVQNTATGCVQRSDSVRIVFSDRIDVLFDSIPALCGQADVTIPLQATPLGGVFSGKGVTSTTFDARLAGVGTHPITYTYRISDGCTATATRIAQVVSAPRAFVGSTKVILQGDSVQLKSSVTPGAVYEWLPPLGLNDPSVSEPMASPEQTTTYRLRVSTANGCFSESEVLVQVLPSVKIPNGFTPNGDGTNDTWEIENSASYPDSKVEVFNRWGSRVFSSQGYATNWDGRLNNEDLPAATYYYVIKLHPDLPVRSGSVTIFR